MLREPGETQRLEFGRPRLHPLESALVTVTILHVIFLPWALGTMHAWSQLTSLGFSLAGFVLAALPRYAVSAESPDEPRAWRSPTQLARSPIFWAALFLIAYLLVQALNPSWRFHANADRWWLEPVKSISWLPSSVDAPFTRSNPWRTLTVVCSLAMLTISVWLGFTRRRSYHRLFFALALNAGLLAVVGFAQRLSGTERIFGIYLPSNYSFVASFIYPNHAGCYFNLMTALSVGLAWWHYSRYRKKSENPTPTVIAIWLALLCAGIVVISYSRISIMLMGAFVFIICTLTLYRLTQQRGRLIHRADAAPLAMLFFTLTGVGAGIFGSETIRERFSKITLDPELVVHSRSLARQAATDMFRDYWPTGWGAGCFQYGFSKYTEKYPSIQYLANGHPRFWEHAHNDFLEILCEIGFLGALPIGFILGRIAWNFWRRRNDAGIFSHVLVIACSLTLVHSWLDFVFQNPAVLLTWATLLVGAQRWPELDRAAGAQEKRPQLPERKMAYIPARGASSSA